MKNGDFGSLWPSLRIFDFGSLYYGNLEFHSPPSCLGDVLESTLDRLVSGCCSIKLSLKSANFARTDFLIGLDNIVFGFFT